MNARAITIHQPWASLVAVGAKTIETRSWKAPASAIGQPLLIHAGLATRRMRDVVQAANMHRTDAIRFANAVDAALGWAHWEWAETWGALPLGAVVASCQLVDCVPIVDDTRARNCVDVRPDRGTGGLRQDSGEFEVMTDLARQLPFGDFSPGGYAWLLEDVKATSERCPRCWGTGHLVWDVETAEPCPTCTTGEPPWRGRRGDGSCPPVPMRGHQGIFTPTWETT